jgi:hypothetical protein
MKGRFIHKVEIGQNYQKQKIKKNCIIPNMVISEQTILKIQILEIIQEIIQNNYLVILLK